MFSQTWIRNILAVVLLVLIMGVTHASVPVDVPYMNGIAVDGDFSDWGTGGFMVAITSNLEGDTYAPDDFDLEYRLAWCDEGMLVAARVRDDQIMETKGVSNLQQGDSMQYWMGVGENNADYCRFVIGTDADPEHPDHRMKYWDRRINKTGELSITYAGKKTDGGYDIEVLMPWSNLKFSPKMGETFGFQLDAADVDTGKNRCRLLWHPDGDMLNPNDNPEALFAVRLSEKAGPPALAMARAQASSNRDGALEIQVRTAAGLVGKELVLEGDYLERPITRTVQEIGHGRGETVFTVQATNDVKPGEMLSVLYEGRRAAGVLIDDAAYLLSAKALVSANFRFFPSVFYEDSFPVCEFEKPLLAESIIGPYEIKTKFYDAEYNQVEAPEKTGWYGAVSEIILENGGKTIKRYRTLYKTEKNTDFWKFDLLASMRLPEGMGVDSAVVEEQSGSISNYVRSIMERDFYTNPLFWDANYGSAAGLLAGLYNMSPGMGKTCRGNDAMAVDRQKWVELKRKLNGMDEEYPYVVVCPRRTADAPAPVVHKGTMKEAGMKSDAADNIDKVLKAFEAETDEGFAVAVVRHGVIVLNKAYGTRDGEPMTVDTKSWMASISKIMGANMIFMLVDQGLVDLDEPIDKYVPAMRGIEVEQPLTIRHLMTHTSGFSGEHWGDGLHDYEEISAEYYPKLRVGHEFIYGGMGPALAGKVVEEVSGECMPMFFKRHILDPLGCTGTDYFDMSAGSFSVPLDIAKIGQLMLNKGAYGNMRFYSEETLSKMMPQKLTKTLGPDTNMEWGICVGYMNRDGLSEKTFGHGAASSAIFFIDPENDLVIVMTRNRYGKGQDYYLSEFIKTILDNIEG